MRRKLIKQGGFGLTIYLPKHWTDEKELQAGQEVEVQQVNDALIISTTKILEEQKIINLVIKEEKQATLRSQIVNAYRAGYDKINIFYPGKIQDILDIVQENLLGFEVFTKEQNECTIERVAEPHFDDFEKITHKQFFLVLEILKTIEEKNLTQKVISVQKYDNFLKRCIVKKIFGYSQPFFWELLTNLTRIARLCLHVHNHLQKKKTKFTDSQRELVQKAITIFTTLQTAYFKKDLGTLARMYKMARIILYDDAEKFLLQKNQFATHYLLTITRFIYLCDSPVTGMIEFESMQEKKIID